MVLFRVWEACFLGVGVCFGFSLLGWWFEVGFGLSVCGLV